MRRPPPSSASASMAREPSALLRPQRHAAPSGERRAADREVGRRRRAAARPGSGTRSSAPPCAGARRSAQQRREQRPVDDEPGIALDLGDVAPVVVDAVAVEGQGRVAEQQHVVGVDVAAPGGVRAVRAAAPAPPRRPRAGRGRRCRAPRRAPTPVAVRDLVAHQDEDERAGAALLQADVGDGRGAPDRVADPERRGGSRSGRRPTSAAAAARAAGSRRAWRDRPGRSRTAGAAAGSRASATSGGSGVPGAGAGSSRSSVAARAATGTGVTTSSRTSWRPIQAFSSAMSSVMVGVLESRLREGWVRHAAPAAARVRRARRATASSTIRPARTPTPFSFSRQDASRLLDRLGRGRQRRVDRPDLGRVDRGLGGEAERRRARQLGGERLGVAQREAGRVDGGHAAQRRRPDHRGAAVQQRLPGDGGPEVGREVGRPQHQGGEPRRRPRDRVGRGEPAGGFDERHQPRRAGDARQQGVDEAELVRRIPPWGRGGSPAGPAPRAGPRGRRGPPAYAAR